MRLPVVAIVGRPNVGKSTLFNRLAGRRLSIVEDLPGVTRDRIYAEAVFSPDAGEDMRYTIIDTGGFEPEPSSPLFAAVREQTQLAIDEADAVVLVTDARAGVLPDDVEVARMLRRSGRPVVVAVNKADNAQIAMLAASFYELGLNDIHAISASHGTGVSALVEGLVGKLPQHLIDAGVETERLRQSMDDLENDSALDAALEAALLDGEGEDPSESPEHDGEEERAAPVVALPEVLRLAVVGRPNAGKSSLVNKLLGENRHLVSDIPGTTIDAVDSFVEFSGRRYRLIDTAGIRRKRSISQRMEKYAVVSALKGLDRCDVALFVVDALAGITEQDMRIAAFAHDKGCAIVIVVNKWDLARAQGMDADSYTEQLRDKLAFVSFAPVRFVSALTGRRVHDLLKTADEVAAQHFTRVSTADVNRVLRRAVSGHQPPMHQGRRVKLLFATQVRVAPPTFVIASNDPEGVHFSYRRYLMNQIRDAFGFSGAPVRLFFRKRGEDRS